MTRHLTAFAAAFAVLFATHVHAQNVGLAAFTGSGALDPAFGINGKAVFAFPGVAAGMAIDSKGRIVVVGTSAGSQIVIARYRPAGQSIDTNFGTAGFVTTSIPGGATGRAVAIGAGDAIVVAGRVNGSFAVLRFDRTGVQLTPVNCPPVFPANWNGEAFAVTIADDGSIVAAGARPSFNRILVARFTGEGCRDPGFAGGFAISAFDASLGSETTWQAGKAVAIDGSGRILVGGPLWAFTSGNGGSVCMSVVRFGDSGFVDQSYGIAGSACALLEITFYPAPFDESANSMIVRNGHAWVAGIYNGSRLARFDVSGHNTLLTSAGVNPRALTLTPDGTALMVGGSKGLQFFGVAELTFTGTLVPTFGQSGVSTVDVDCTSTNYVAGIANQLDGWWRTVAAGPSGPNACQ